MLNLIQKNSNYQNLVELDNKPENYRLYQNFPQSFYKFTRISFDIPQKSNVKIVIYDAFGQDKNILLEKELQTGSYELKWNASSLKAGVYYYKIYADEFVDSKKIMLLNN